MRADEATAFDRLVAAVEAASDEDLFTAGRFASTGRATRSRQPSRWISTSHYPEHLPHLAA